MPIEHLVNHTVHSLNSLFPNQGWQGLPYVGGNVRPWARIFNETMRQTWPATMQHSFPVSWFEIKCVNARPGHDGGGPYTVFILLNDKYRLDYPEKSDACVARIEERLPTIADNVWQLQLSEAIHLYQHEPKRFELDPRLVLDDSYLDTVVGYISLRKQLFL